MLKIAICDDDQDDLIQLKQMCESCKVPISAKAYTYSTGADLLKAAKQIDFDILMLDVEMPGQNGILIGKEIRDMFPHVIIIFCTNYPQYAIEAYDCEAFYYLLKPANANRLHEILNRAIKKINLTHTTHIVKIHNRVRPIPIADIYYIECQSRHIIYHMKNEKDNIQTSGKINEIYAELSNFGFSMVHQGYIVNLSKVKDFEGYNVILDNNVPVMISIRRKRAVLLEYAQYVEDFL